MFCPHCCFFVSLSVGQVCLAVPSTEPVRRAHADDVHDYATARRHFVLHHGWLSSAWHAYAASRKCQALIFFHARPKCLVRVNQRCVAGCVRGLCEPTVRGWLCAWFV